MQLPKLHTEPRGAFYMLGTSIYLCQLVEKQMARITTMWEMLTGKRPRNKNFNVTYEDAMEKRLKQNLGKLIPQFKSALPVSEFEVLIEDARKARNWIAHHSLVENAKFLYSQDGELKAIELLKEASLKVYRLLRALDEIDDAICERLGYSRDQRLKDYIEDIKTFMNG